MVLSNPEKRRRVLFYGDSNTYGTDPTRGRGGGRYPAEIRWTDILTGRLMGMWDVFTDARPGRCIPELDFEWSDLRDSVSRSAPLDLFAVMLGTNDYLSGARPDAAFVAARMERFVTGLLSGKEPCMADTRILMIAPPYLDFGADRFYGAYSTTSGVLSEALRQCAQNAGIDFLDAGAWNLPLTADGIHLSAEGHRIFAENMRLFMADRLP